MEFSDIAALLVFFTILIVSSVLLGRYMKKVFSGEKTFLTPVIRPVEKVIYRICGVDETSEMTWKRYALGFTLFNLAGIIALMAMQMLQGKLPLNPQHFPGVRWDSALNTAISFVTNTNWQGYGGENTMSYFTQIMGLAVQNFVSAAIGMAAGVALIRGFTRREAGTIGNIWVDMTRAVLYILIPLSIVVSVILISQGVIQTFHPYVTADTLEGSKQVIPLGPAASQVAIKQLGTNGGGFFNANSAHPFENPTFITNVVETFSIIIVAMAFVFMFGFMVNNRRQGRVLFLTMAFLFAIGFSLMTWSEFQLNPALHNQGIAYAANMEGKETRNGVLWSVLWSQITTATSNGSVNSMHDSFNPLSGMAQMFNMGIGEVIFGGVGVGLAGFMMYVVLSMFVVGLMVGRTPEFLGKKLGPYEMAMSMIALLLPMITAVILSAIAVSVNAGISSLNNPSSHGLSEILYAYFSCVGNNGSSFAGLNSNTLFYNTTLSAALIAGRFATVIPALAMAGSLASKKTVPDSLANFPATGMLFVAVVAGVIIIMGALTFFPVFALGPVLEHLFMRRAMIF